MIISRLFHFYTCWFVIFWLISLIINKSYLCYYSAIFVFVIGQYIAVKNYVENISTMQILIIITLIHSIPFLYINKPKNNKEINESLRVLVLSLLLYVLIMTPFKIYDIYFVQGAKKYLKL